MRVFAAFADQRETIEFGRVRGADHIDSEGYPYLEFGKGFEPSDGKYTLEIGQKCPTYFSTNGRQIDLVAMGFRLLKIGTIVL